MRLGPKLLALALAGALLLGGCTSPTQEQSSAPPVSPTATAQPIQAGVFSLAWDPQQSFHPITGTSGVNLELTGLVFQGLYELDQSFHPQPVLAAGATASQDGRTWTVEVAQGVRFSDGTPLTAAQVVSSLETARTASRYQSRLSAVTGVRQTGEYTVEVTLSAPNANFTALLDIPVVAEREGQNPLGTGPYRLGDGALEQNPNSSLAGSLPAENIPLVAVSTPDARMAAFDSGEVWMTNTEFFSPDALGYSGSCEVWDYPTTQLLYLGFHTQGGACGEETLRRAVSGALNRESLVQVQLSGHGDPTDLPISPVWGELPEVEVEAGAPAAATLRLVVNNDNTTRVQVARQIAVQLEGAGFTVTVEELAWEDYVSALERGDFDLYLGQVQLTPDFDLTPLLTGALAYGGAQSQVQSLLSAWRGTGGETEWKAYLEGFAQHSPLAPICFLRGSLLVRWGLVSGVAPTQANPYANVAEWTIWSSVKDKQSALQGDG